jgi:Peptidase family S41/Tricorn protease C1 domain
MDMQSRIRRLVLTIARAGRGPTLVLVAAIFLIAGLASTARAQAPTSQWQQAIDATWGPGLPTERKLEIFDTFWTTIDERFAAFQGIDVDWAAVRERYRPEIAAGVSRGRFAAIMGQLALALRDGHTFAFDLPVLQTQRIPGVPIMVLRGAFFNTFGACATAQDDGSALIYDVAPGHPLGLERGDRILGYDGRPWRALVSELLAAELPWAGNSWGSSPNAFEHTLVQSANVNWHLFDTIDIRKHATGTVEHHPTARLNTTPPLRSPFCSEQLAVPGVPKPAALTHTVSWGIVEGTRIGYVYVSIWDGDAGTRFEQAIRELTQERATDGLIIDFRLNRGGNMFLSDAALGMLFDRPVPTIGVAERADPGDHFKMRPIVGETSALCPGRPGFPPIHNVIDMCDGIYDRRSYDRPIAVLAGPGAISSGDQVALRMTYHPRARVFGKTTNTAFNSPCDLNIEAGWNIAYACADAYRIDAPHDYLTHDEFPVDEPVWLRPDDVARGKDTVVDAAVRWITSQTQ